MIRKQQWSRFGRKAASPIFKRIYFIFEMQIMRNIEDRGRAAALGGLSRVMRVHETNALEAAASIGRLASPRILLIGLYQHMGQFLCATPLLRAMKAAWPNAALHFIGNPVNAAAARANPDLDRVLVWNKSASFQWVAQSLRLRQERYDLALLLTTERPSATGVVLARVSGARYVAGYVPAVSDAWARSAISLCHIRIPFNQEKNEVEKFAGFARAFGMRVDDLRPEFVPSSADEAAADVFLANQSFSNKGPLVGLFVGGKAERTDRLWPVSHFARLAQLLREKDCRVIAISPPAPAVALSDTFRSEEHLRLAEFRKEINWECPAFQATALGHVAAFLRRLDLFVCPDGGIMHLAAAVGTPTLAFFFSTDPEVWTTFRVRSSSARILR